MIQPKIDNIINERRNQTQNNIESSNSSLERDNIKPNVLEDIKKIPNSGFSPLITFPQYENLFFNGQVSADNLVHATVLITCHSVDPKLLPLLPMLTRLIPALGARDKDRSDWVQNILSKYTSGIECNYSIQFNRIADKVVLSLSSSCEYRNIYKMMDALSAYALESQIRNPNLDLSQHLLPLLMQQFLKNQEIWSLDLANCLRYDAASMLSRMSSFISCISGFHTINFFSKMLESINTQDPNAIREQTILVQGAIQTLYYQLTKFGVVDVLVTAEPGKATLVSEAASSHFNLRKTERAVENQFIPMDRKKFICAKGDQAKLFKANSLSGSLCRTASVIIETELVARCLLIIELIKLHYETDVELSKLPVAIDYTFDGIISITVADHPDAFSILQDIDNLLCNSSRMLLDIFEKLEDKLYEEGQKLLTVLKLRILNRYGIGETAIIHPHDRVRRDLDLTEQTKEINLLGELHKHILQVVKWENMSEYCERLKNETKCSICLMGREEDMPYEVKNSDGKTWLILGSENFKPGMKQQEKDSKPKSNTVEQFSNF